MRKTRWEVVLEVKGFKTSQDHEDWDWLPLEEAVAEILSDVEADLDAAFDEHCNSFIHEVTVNRVVDNREETDL